MFENIWRGIEINYFYLANHSLQVLVVVLFIASLILLRSLLTLRQHQQKTYSEIVEQHHHVEDIQYRLGRINRICQENRDKQRFISNQLQKVDNSIFELEEALTMFKEKLIQNSSRAIYEFEKE